MNDFINKVGKATYIMKLSQLKGYWCVPLTKHSKGISAFATSDGLYLYHIIPFRMKNSQITSQQMMNHCLRDLAGVEMYIDDIVVYNNT